MLAASNREIGGPPLAPSSALISALSELTSSDDKQTAIFADLSKAWNPLGKHKPSHLPQWYPRCTSCNERRPFATQGFGGDSTKDGYRNLQVMCGSSGTTSNARYGCGAKRTLRQWIMMVVEDGWASDEYLALLEEGCGPNPQPVQQARPSRSITDFFGGKRPADVLSPPSNARNKIACWGDEPMEITSTGTIPDSQTGLEALSAAFDDDLMNDDDLEALRSKLATLEAENLSLKSRNRALQDENSKLHATIGHMKEKVDSHDKAITDLYTMVQGKSPADRRPGPVSVSFNVDDGRVSATHGPVEPPLMGAMVSNHPTADHHPRSYANAVGRSNNRPARRQARRSDWAKDLLNPSTPMAMEYSRIRFQMPPRAQMAMKTMDYTKVLHEIRRQTDTETHVLRSSTIGRSIGEFYIKQSDKQTVYAKLSKAGLTLLNDNWSPLSVPAHVAPSKTAEYMEFAKEKLVDRLTHLIIHRSGKSFKRCVLEGIPLDVVNAIDRKLGEGITINLDNLLPTDMNQGETPSIINA
jgi:hypothetical protein